MVINRSREEWKTYAGVFDSHTIKNLQKLSAQGHFEELEVSLALGKEANIFLARTKEDNLVVLKIYRLENCDFNKMYSYISQDPRYDLLKGSKRRVIFEWTRREYRNLQLARECIRVPIPYHFKDNIIIMEYVQDDKNPAPQLKNTSLDDPQGFFDLIIEKITDLYAKGLVHGDLSAFNILVEAQQPVFIDFSQSTPTSSNQADELLYRDLKNICIYFKKQGIYLAPEPYFEKITGRTTPEIL
ncbi:MAG: serine protein kinase RIO [Nanobdellota archaeon]